MKGKAQKRSPKILKINSIDKKHLKISILFSNGEDRIIDFDRVFKRSGKLPKMRICSFQPGGVC